MEFLNSLKEQINTAKTYISGKAIAASMLFAGMFSTLTVSSFAAEGDLPTVSITTEMLKPLVEGVVANVGVVLPIGLGLFSIFVGIKLIPKLFSKFIKI